MTGMKSDPKSNPASSNSSVSGKLSHTNIDVDDKRLTKTAAYLFYVEISLYHESTVNKIFEELNPTQVELASNLFEPVNVYIADKARTDYDYTNTDCYLYHIRIDKRCPRFNEYFPLLKEKMLTYVDSYQCKDVDNNFVIVRAKVHSNKRMKHLLDSEYSKLYREVKINPDGSESINSWPLVKTSSIRAKYFYYKNNQYFAKKVTRVLTKDPDLYHELLERLDIDQDSDLGKQMLEREFESKLDLNKEITNSNEY